MPTEPATTPKEPATEPVSRGWQTLCPELRVKILKEVAWQKNSLRYATVSREWQFWIESCQFSHIRLCNQDKLDELASNMVPRQQGHVRYIWLNIELRAYDCWDCWMRESTAEVETNTETITATIERLYRTLSSWQPTGHGLTLELSVQSPADKWHWFPHWYYGGRADVPDSICMSADVLRLPPRSKAAAAFQGWSSMIDEMALDRIWGQRRNLFFVCPLPRVEAVTRFVLRRQSRRRLPLPGLKLMLESLPRLATVTYEPWGPWTRRDQRKLED
ncbi:hypothetical protein E4U53_005373, partial [Claviceps sorghi]